MRLSIVAIALASAMLVVPATASASDIGIPIIDYLYNWPTECGQERFWTTGLQWEGHCVEGVRFFSPGTDGTKPIVICVTCDAELLP